MGLVALVNSNRMRPGIAPVALDYLASALIEAGHEVDVLDLCLAEDVGVALRGYFSCHEPLLTAVTFRNFDDCFWSSSTSFVGELRGQLDGIRELTGSPIVLGGVGFSLFPERLVDFCGVDFGICGDGEGALVELMGQLEGGRRFDGVSGLLWREDGDVRFNRPMYDEGVFGVSGRDAVDNGRYFRLGGQVGIETKRGCSRSCLYCPEPAVKGRVLRVRGPEAVADEVEALLRQGVDVLHICDSEFNLPIAHGRAVCEALIGRGLGERVRWYAYLSVLPFDDELAGLMRRAGCVGINFTADSANEGMLAVYGQCHGRADLRRAVQLCRKHGIAVMLDLLIGGPGETAATVADSIEFWKAIDPDCAGAALGLRVYPNTPLAAMLAGEGNLARHGSIRRGYDGPVDFFRPTFYVSEGLGDRPASLVRDLIGGDTRFFEPADEPGDGVWGDGEGSDHNYNDNPELTAAIAAGHRGAYWDILRRIRGM